MSEIITLAEVLRDRPDYAERVTHAMCGSCGGPLEGGLWDDRSMDGADIIRCRRCYDEDQDALTRAEEELRAVRGHLARLEDLAGVEALTGAETLQVIRALQDAGRGQARYAGHNRARSVQEQGIMDLVRARIAVGLPLHL
jgi:hypothetical protein